jgi:hypothetical protein
MQVVVEMFKETGQHSNAWFSLFVPKDMFEAEEKNGRICKEMCCCDTLSAKNDQIN